MGIDEDLWGSTGDVGHRGMLGELRSMRSWKEQDAENC